MAVWMIRGGKDGVFEQLALEKGLAIIGWAEMPDLAEITTQQGLRTLCESAYPDAPEARIRNFVGRLWAFRDRMSIGDLVVMPMKGQDAIAVGEIEGPYEYRKDLPGRATHVRRVKWLRTDIPRTALVAHQDLLQSLNSPGTLKAVGIERAEERVRAILSGGTTHTDNDSEQQDADDIEEMAHDRIKRRIGQAFRDHDLARLVDELLKTQGYKTQFSSPGPDGGVDILAGAGPMGFDHPRLCVQVKSGQLPADVGVLRELQGVMKSFGANQGLLVSWGGYRNNVYTEARKHFFEVRLWNAEDLLSQILQHYDRLPEDIRTDLPLKTIHILVPED